jgi:hypothetical protein
VTGGALGGEGLIPRGIIRIFVHKFEYQLVARYLYLLIKLTWRIKTNEKQ